MGDGKTVEISGKAAWNTPNLVELDLGLENVENGFNPGSDGAGGLLTSLS